MPPTRWPRSITAASPLERTWSPLHRRAETLQLPPVPTLVVAPHPDDEVLLAGGLIATQRSRGVDVHVLAVTDGEAAYDVDDPAALASKRRTEQLAALGELGVEPHSITRLGLPDGAVPAHVDTVADAVASLAGFGLVVAPWTGDHHCDHEATGAAVRRGAARSGAAVLFGLFWTWHHRRPEELADERIAMLDLADDAMRRRGRALRRHDSQFSAEHGRAQLTQQLVEPAGWPVEYFIVPQCGVPS